MWPAETKLTKYARKYCHGMDAFKPASNRAIVCVELLYLDSRRLSVGLGHNIGYSQEGKQTSVVTHTISIT